MNALSPFYVFKGHQINTTKQRVVLILHHIFQTGHLNHSAHLLPKENKKYEQSKKTNQNGLQAECGGHLLFEICFIFMKGNKILYYFE